jgi:hypothetical protein
MMTIVGGIPVRACATVSRAMETAGPRLPLETLTEPRDHAISSDEGDERDPIAGKIWTERFHK